MQRSGDVPARSGVRVLLALDATAAWSRGTVRGFARVADEQGWTLLHLRQAADLDRVARELMPRVAVIGPPFAGHWPEPLRSCISVAINADRSEDGIASVLLDDARVIELAVAHLRGRGLRNVTTFRFGSWGALREHRFRQAAARSGAHVEPVWWPEMALPLQPEEHAAAILAWLSQLKKPCGVFALCDAWARMLARYVRAAGLRVPEDVALVGVDNDTFECELTAPALSSVAVPWLSLGESAARLVQLGLRGTPIVGRRVLVQPLEVVERRSSDALAIDDSLVAAAVTWIHQHVAERLTVPMLSSAVRVSRQRLERHFRRHLGRTVAEEIRRTRVELARRLLAATELALPEIARKSGFTTSALLSVAFRREVGVPPGAYRRALQGRDNLRE